MRSQGPWLGISRLGLEHSRRVQRTASALLVLAAIVAVFLLSTVAARSSPARSFASPAATSGLWSGTITGTETYSTGDDAQHPNGDSVTDVENWTIAVKNLRPPAPEGYALSPAQGFGATFSGTLTVDAVSGHGGLLADGSPVLAGTRHAVCAGTEPARILWGFPARSWGLLISAPGSAGSLSQIPCVVTTNPEIGFPSGVEQIGWMPDIGGGGNSPIVLRIVPGQTTIDGAVRGGADFALTEDDFIATKSMTISVHVMLNKNGSRSGLSGSTGATGSGGAKSACVVPHLTGLTLAASQAALGRAHCALGAVRRPMRLVPGRVLRVTSQSASPGSRHRAHFAVSIVLGAR
jgi:hypothetical protein